MTRPSARSDAPGNTQSAAPNPAVTGVDLKAIRARCGKGHVSLRHLAQRAAYCVDPMSDGGVAAAQALADIPSLIHEVERLRWVEKYAREVMEALERHGAGIVGHLLDTDDNSGEFLRQALGIEPKQPCSCSGKGWVDDESWQGDYLGPGVQAVRNFYNGWVPCGFCNPDGEVPSA